MNCFFFDIIKTNRLFFVKDHFFYKGRGTLRLKNAPTLKIQFKHIQTINLTQNKQFLVKLDNSRTYPIYFKRVCPLCGNTVRNPIPSG